MRYLALWFACAVVIYVAFLDTPYTGPELSLVVVPIWSGVLSSFVLLVALLIGLPVRLPAISRIWHQTSLGVIIAGTAMIVGLIIIFTAYNATQRATVTNGVRALCGLLAIEFGIIHCPQRRKA
jgi:hypothetical protein